MPCLAVPLLSQLLLDRSGPVARALLIEEAVGRMRAAPDMFLLEGDESPAEIASAALEQMEQRRFVEIAGDTVTARAEEAAALRFYANSISNGMLSYSAAAK